MSISRESIKSFTKVKKLDLSNNVCVNQLFEYIAVPKRPGLLLDAILFPKCDENWKKDDIEDSTDVFVVMLVGATAIIIIILVSCLIAALVQKENGHQKIEEDTRLRDLIKEYLGDSTIHGIRYLGPSVERHWMEK
jgi:hypothetical protein